MERKGGGDGKEVDSGQISEAEPARFAGGQDVRCKEKKRRQGGLGDVRSEQLDEDNDHYLQEALLDCQPTLPL